MPERQQSIPHLQFSTINSIIWICVRSFSGLTFIRYARGRNIGNPVNDINHYKTEITKQGQNSEILKYLKLSILKYEPQIFAY